MAETIVKMTREQYRQKYGQEPPVPAAAAPVEQAPVKKMTREEYHAQYGVWPEGKVPLDLSKVELKAPEQPQTMIYPDQPKARRGILGAPLPPTEEELQSMRGTPVPLDAAMMNAGRYQEEKQKYERRKALQPESIEGTTIPDALASAIPFIGGAPAAVEAVRLQQATQRAREGKQTDEDLQVIKAAVLDAQRGSTFGADLASGIASSARVMGQAGIGSVLGPAGSVAAIAADPAEFTRRMSGLMTAGIEIEQGKDGKPTGRVFLTEPTDTDALTAAGRTAALQAATGGIEVLGGKAASKVVGGVAKRVLPAGAQQLARRAAISPAGRALEKGAFSGIIPEAGEEIAQAGADMLLGEQEMGNPLSVVDPRTREGQVTLATLGLIGGPAQAQGLASIRKGSFGRASKLARGAIEKANVRAEQRQAAESDRLIQEARAQEMATRAEARAAAPYAPVVTQASQENRVPENLVHALIEAESGGLPDFDDKKNHVGLMGLTRTVAGDNDRLDPARNVAAGTRYLSTLLGRHNGDLDAALDEWWFKGRLENKKAQVAAETIKRNREQIDEFKRKVYQTLDLAPEQTAQIPGSTLTSALGEPVAGPQGGIPNVMVPPTREPIFGATAGVAGPQGGMQLTQPEPRIPVDRFGMPIPPPSNASGILGLVDFGVSDQVAEQLADKLDQTGELTKQDVVDIAGVNEKTAKRIRTQVATRLPQLQQMVRARATEAQTQAQPEQAQPAPQATQQEQGATQPQTQPISQEVIPNVVQGQEGQAGQVAPQTQQGEATPMQPPAAPEQQAAAADRTQSALAQMVEDHIANYKSKGAKVPEHLIKKQAELSGADLSPKEVAGAQVFGHPLATNIRPDRYGNLVPIKASDAESINRRIDKAQSLVDELQSRLVPRKGIKPLSVEESTILELLREETLPELYRMAKALQSNSVKEQASPGQAVPIAPVKKGLYRGDYQGSDIEVEHTKRDKANPWSVMRDGVEVNTLPTRQAALDYVQGELKQDIDSEIDALSAPLEQEGRGPQEDQVKQEKKTKAQINSEYQIHMAVERILQSESKSERARNSDKTKREHDKAWSTIRLHANKLGIDIPKQGKFFDPDEDIESAKEISKLLPPWEQVYRDRTGTNQRGPQEANLGIFDDILEEAKRGKRYVESLYQKAKPTLQSLYDKAKSAGQSAVQWIKDMVRQFGEHVGTYARKFASEVGRIVNENRGAALNPFKIRYSGMEFDTKQGRALNVPATESSARTFANDVKRIVDKAPESARFGDRKVFISDVYNEYNKGRDPMPREVFNSLMIDAQQRGMLQMSRADLVQAMDPNKVKDSAIFYLNGEFNFVNRDGFGNASSRTGGGMSNPERGAALHPMEYVQAIRRSAVGRATAKVASQYEGKPRALKEQQDRGKMKQQAAVYGAKALSYRISLAVRRKQVTQAQLDKALIQGDKAALASMPADVRSAVTEARNHITRLQMRLGGLLREMGMSADAARVFASVNTYLHRSYRMFDPDMPFDRWLREAQKMPEWAAMAKKVGGEAELKDMLRQMRGEDVVSYAGKRGRADINPLKPRKVDDPMLRKIMGEKTGALDMYLDTISSLIGQVANYEMQKNIRDAGMGKFLWDDKTKPNRIDGQIPERIGNPDNKALGFLSGLWATPDVARIFNEVVAAGQDPTWYSRIWNTADGMTKLAKTVWNVPMGVARQIPTNLMFLLSTGTFFRGMSYLPSAINAVAAYDFVDSKFEGNFRNMQKEVEEAIEYGIFETEVVTNQVGEDIAKGVISDISLFDPVRRGIDFGKKVGGMAKTLYQNPDAITKFAAWKSIQDQYRNYAKKRGWTDQQLKEFAASKVLRWIPNNYLINGIGRAGGNVPVLSPFIRWMMSTTLAGVNVFSDTIREAMSGDTAIRNVALARIPGLIMGAGAAELIIQEISKVLAGIGDDDEKVFRDSAPEWGRDNTKLFLDKQHAIDLGYASPYPALTGLVVRAVNAYNRDDKQGVMEELQRTLVDTFLSGSMLLNPAASIFFGVDPDSGRKTRAPEMSNQQVLSNVLEAVEEAFKPGGTTLDRLEAAWQQKDFRGQKVTWKGELQRVLLGLPVTKVDAVESFSRDADQYVSNRVWRDIYIFEREENGRTHREATRIVNEQRRAEFDRVFTRFQFMNKTDPIEFSRTKIRNALLRQGMSPKTARSIVLGRYTPYEPEELKK